MQHSADTRLPVLTVTEVTGEIQWLFEEHFDRVSVQGEISQPSVSRNGHLYFTLKDSGAQLSCVMWNSKRQQLETPAEHGQEVIASGPIQIYPPHGRYQLIVHTIQQAGLGALQQAFEHLKKKLEAEGLFDSSRKKTLPAWPQTIGIVTSATGAAFQDIRNTLEKRYPLCRILLYHAAVQGRQAAPEIASGIHYFSKSGLADLLIVGRGGGSLEDLWAFNEEIVARAIAECPIPVISAVGHETDFSISDFVADLRAATPTQAVILAVPDREEWLQRIDDAQRTIEKRIGQMMQQHHETVARFLDNYVLHKVSQRIARLKETGEWQQERMRHLLESRVQAYQGSLRSLADRLEYAAFQMLMKRNSAHQQLHHQLAALDPDMPLHKGYTRIWQDGKWIRKVPDFQASQELEIEWAHTRSRIKPQKT